MGMHHVPSLLFYSAKIVHFTIIITIIIIIVVVVTFYYYPELIDTFDIKYYLREDGHPRSAMVLV
jgi:hypothetical protein